MDKKQLRDLRGIGFFNDIDIHFANTLVSYCHCDVSDEIVLLFALTCHVNTEKKHVCLDLNYCSRATLADFFPEWVSNYYDTSLKNTSVIQDLNTLRHDLLTLPVVGRPEDQGSNRTPLVLDSANRLYLFRYWNYEQILAGKIKELACQQSVTVDLIQAKTDLSAYYDFKKQHQTGFSIDLWQKVAIFAALKNNLTVISGGPGTGKTTITAAILSLLVKQFKRDTQVDFTISICAPTGKAAARIKESIAENTPPEVKALVELDASTIHRLLGYRHNSPYFHYNAGNMLPADIIIVDEASMIPLSLMTKLLQAVRPSTKVILLGDKDQLASVESGAILADICNVSELNLFTPQFIDDFSRFDMSQELQSFRSAQSHVLTDSTVALLNSYRFNSNEGIGQLSREINAGTQHGADIAWQELTRQGSSTIEWQELPAAKDLRLRLESLFSNTWFFDYLKCPTIDQAFRQFKRFCILCSHRTGTYGVKAVNQALEELLIKCRRIQKQGRYFKGCPVMISQNDYTLNLFNGDIGLLWCDDNEQQLRVFFENPAYDQRHDPPEKRFISFNPNRLPEHDVVFAMTVHKSQGSGFEQVLIILPEEANSPILTKELLYTAITRAEKRVVMWCREQVFKASVMRSTVRHSGLRDLL